MREKNCIIGWAVFTLFLGSCANPVDQVIMQSQAPERVNGFKVGEQYETTQSLYLVRQGRVAALVPKLSLKATAYNKTSAPQTLSAGATLRVTKMQVVNTVTHGSMYWPEAQIVSGAQKGKNVSLGHQTIRNSMRRLK